MTLSAAVSGGVTADLLYVRLRAAPIYNALLLGDAGVVLLGGRVTRVWVWLAPPAVLVVKSRIEEAALRARFPGYDDYAATTPRLMPSPAALPGAQPCWLIRRRPFSVPLFLRPCHVVVG